LEIDGEVLSLKTHKPTQLDLLVCAGGSNDSIRDKYLGKFKKKSMFFNGHENYLIFEINYGK
jgi:hypothetical protein